jgi:hypothetical protein
MMLQRLRFASTCLLGMQRPPGGYNITIYHTMRDEVDSYRTHVWQCSSCGTTSKRSMNRKPQEADCRSGGPAVRVTCFMPKSLMVLVDGSPHYVLHPLVAHIQYST